MASPLLLTKLHVPSPQSNRVRRDRILQKLQQGLTGRVILVSAAAGFGKTTALGEWIQQLQQPVGWLSLDERDNDPARFWTYLVAALQKVDESIGAATLSMVQSPEPFPYEAFLTPLLNELIQLPTRLIGVLDDYHLITTPVIHAGLTFLVEHLPEGMQVAIATRVDPPLPLARWRVRSQLTELRAADLRFTDKEATVFLQQSPSLTLTEPQIGVLQRQTEGWIAGLQLAMLSLRDATNPAAVIDNFRGSKRYVLDYLVEEVLDHQPPLLQDFLLKTSILERMCGALCAAVVGDERVAGTHILEQLERQNLFVVPLNYDGHGPSPEGDSLWYRYHHLFAETLRHLLLQTDPARVVACHYRAAQWYDLQGQVADAIHHAIAARSYDYAVHLIEQEMQTSENPRLDTIVLREALAALPSELVHTRPWLLAAMAWEGFTSSRFAEAIAVIERLDQWLEDNPPATENNDQLWGLVVALKGIKARRQGHNTESVAFMEKALQWLPKDDSWLRLLVLLNLGVTYFVSDNDKAARVLLPEVSRIGQARGAAEPAIAGLYLQGQFLALRGQLDEAISLCQQGLDLATERRWLATYAGVLVEVAIADFLREQNQLEAAAHHATQSLDRAIQNHQPGLMMAYITLARVRQAQGDLPAAWAAIRQAERCQIWLWPTILPVAACKVRLHLAEGDVNAAMAWAESAGLTVEDDLNYNTTAKFPTAAELVYLTYARVLLAYGQSTSSENHLQAALRLLTRLEAFSKAGGRTLRRLETLLLQALLWQIQENQQRAVAYLQQALQIPRQGNYVRLFLDEGKSMAELLTVAASRVSPASLIDPLLSAFAAEAAQPPTAGESSVESVKQALIEPLTERELEVLAYLSTGMTNQDIAGQMFVSLAAVKWHARNIYGKLEVSNRIQAVARGRALNLLP